MGKYGLLRELADNNALQFIETASEVSSIDGVSHLYINKCGRLKHKDTKVIMFGSYYEGEL